MKKFLLLTIMTLFIAFWFIGPVEAKDRETILGGIFIDEISLGGKTAEEAMVLVLEYVDDLGQKEITLNIIDGNYITVTPDEMGFKWSNPEIIEAAAALGQKGNIITRYKAIKDLEHSNKIYQLEYTFDTALIFDIIDDQGKKYNIPAIDATLEIVGNERIITDGQTGLEIDVHTSVDLVIDYLENYWDKTNVSIDLAIAIIEPRGSYELLSSLTDVLGTFTTSFPGSSANRVTNIANGTSFVSGILLYPGDDFNVLKALMPFTEENGYELAGSFLRGQLVDSLGGGICQVSTTLYNALLLAELEILERHSHSMIISYVEPAMDAAIAESSGRSLRFMNNKETPILIMGRTSNDRRVTFTIYGIEDRPSNRVISFETEILETTIPEGEQIFQDSSLPVGHVSVQSAYIGYKSRLWKIVKVDGVEVSRERINNSSYTPVPRSATVGTYTTDANALNHIMAAIATGNIDHIRNVAAALQEQSYVPPVEAHPDDHEW